MNFLLSFSIESNKYIFYELNNDIYLAKYRNNLYIKIMSDEAVLLKSIVNKLLIDGLEKSDFKIYDISFFDYKKESIPDLDNNVSIKLDLSDSNKEIFVNNCNYLYSQSKYSLKSKMSYKSLVGLIFVVIVGFIIFIGTNKIVDNSDLLEKYAYVRDESNPDFYKQSLSVENITYKDSNNLLNDLYVSFENPYPNFSFIKETDGLNIRLYNSGKNGLAIWYIKDYYSNNQSGIGYYSDSTKDIIKETNGIDVDEVFKRNNINNEMDLIYNIVLHSKKEINSKSSKEEIIDNYVFEAYWPIVIPICDDLISFNGDLQGYSCSTDEQLIIELKHNNDAYRILYEYKDLNTISRLTREQIINLVSTVKFN